MTKRDKRRQASVLTTEDIEDYRRWWEERHPDAEEADKARKLDIVRREWQD